MDQIIGIAGALAVAAAGWLARRNVEALWEINNLFRDLSPEPTKRFRATVSVFGMAAIVLGIAAALVLVLELVLR